MKRSEFWVIVGLGIGVITLVLGSMGFMFSMNARMATKEDIAQVKADIARVELDVRDIRNLLIDHIKDGHNHRKPKRRPASENK